MVPEEEGLTRGSEDEDEHQRAGHQPRVPGPLGLVHGGDPQEDEDDGLCDACQSLHGVLDGGPRLLRDVGLHVLVGSDAAEGHSVGRDVPSNALEQNAVILVGDLRQNGRQREELSGQVRQVDQQEDEERLDDADLLGETSDEAEEDGEDQPHQSPANADDEEGSWGREGVGAESWRSGELGNDSVCGPTHSFEVVCCLDVLGSHLHEGNVDFVQNLQEKGELLSSETDPMSPPAQNVNKTFRRSG